MAAFPSLQHARTWPRLVDQQQHWTHMNGQAKPSPSFLHTQEHLEPQPLARPPATYRLIKQLFLAEPEMVEALAHQLLLGLG